MAKDTGEVYFNRANEEGERWVENVSRAIMAHYSFQTKHFFKKVENNFLDSKPINLYNTFMMKTAEENKMFEYLAIAGRLESLVRRAETFGKDREDVLEEINDIARNLRDYAEALDRANLLANT